MRLDLDGERQAHAATDYGSAIEFHGDSLPLLDIRHLRSDDMQRFVRANGPLLASERFRRLGKIAIFSRMTTPLNILAAGNGWRAVDCICTAGPDDPVFEEHRDYVSIGFVLKGVFHYRCPQGAATMAPGGVLLGNYNTCFECGHEHSAGDHCVALHFTPEAFEDAISFTPGLRAASFRCASLPPLAHTARLFADIHLARSKADNLVFEELAFMAVSEVASLAENVGPQSKVNSVAARRRISETIRCIEDDPTSEFTIQRLATEAGMSRYHFLRVFQDVARMTPHQFILHRRMHRAAIELRQTDLSVSTIAFDAGFNDLSTFNKRFRRVMGVSPTAFRTSDGRRVRD